MRKSIIAMGILTIWGLCALSAPAFAGDRPGDWTGIYTARVETHSKVANSTSNKYGNDSYLTDTITFSTPLNSVLTSSLTFVNKYGMKNSEMINNVFTFSLAGGMSDHWKGTMTYTHSNNDSRSFNFRKSNCLWNGVESDCPASDSDTYNFGVKFTPLLGKRKKEARTNWDFKLNYNTATDFSNSRSLTPKISLNTKTTNEKLDFDVDLSGVYALNKKTGPKNVTMGREFNTYKYTAAANYKAGKTTKLELAYTYTDNRFIGNKGDDSKVSLTVTRTFMTPPKEEKKPKAEKEKGAKKK